MICATKAIRDAQMYYQLQGRERLLTTATVERHADRLGHNDWMIDFLGIDPQLDEDIV
jgi:hypothetical protein